MIKHYFIFSVFIVKINLSLFSQDVCVIFTDHYTSRVTDVYNIIKHSLNFQLDCGDSLAIKNLANL